MTQFVLDCVNFILQNTEGAEKLIDQLGHLKIIEKEHTGFGAFYSFLEDSNSGPESQIVRLGFGHTVYSEEVPDGADITLVISSGKIDYLEIFANVQEFPTEDPKNYHFKINSVNVIIDKNS